MQENLYVAGVEEHQHVLLLLRRKNGGITDESAHL